MYTPYSATISEEQRKGENIFASICIKILQKDIRPTLDACREGEVEGGRGQMEYSCTPLPTVRMLNHANAFFISVFHYPSKKERKCNKNRNTMQPKCHHFCDALPHLHPLPLGIYPPHKHVHFFVQKINVKVIKTFTIKILGVIQFPNPVVCVNYNKMQIKKDALLAISSTLTLQTTGSSTSVIICLFTGIPTRLSCLRTTTMLYLPLKPHRRTQYLVHNSG